MKRLFHTAIVIALVLSVLHGAETGKEKSLELTLPPAFYAVPGLEMSIYYDNIVCTETPEKYRFKFKCSIGEFLERRWCVTPKATNVGDFKVSVSVTDESGKIVDKGNTILHVVPADAGAGKEIRLLIIGDSLTAGGVYQTEIARLLSLPGNPAWKMLGTRKATGAVKGVAHEGYGGWTWSRFATHFEPNPDEKQLKISSPFVFLDTQGKPQLDVSRYFKEKCDGEKPDFITVLLGINDCFGASRVCEDQKAVDAIIDRMFTNAEILLAAFRKAAPKADIGVCLTTPPNSRESGFAANYKGKPHRWQWKQVQHHLVQREIEHFGKREKERIFIIPTELNLDPVNGYPDNNGVHPNTEGYKQIGHTIYAWLKWRLHSPR